MDNSLGKYSLRLCTVLINTGTISKKRQELQDYFQQTFLLYEQYTVAQVTVWEKIITV